MFHFLIQLLASYVNNAENLSAIREWLAVYQWNGLSEPETDFVDWIDSLIAQFDDGHMTEDDLRANVLVLLRRRSMRSVVVEFGSGVQALQFTRSSTGSAATESRTEWLIPVGA